MKDEKESIKNKQETIEKIKITDSIFSSLSESEEKYFKPKEYKRDLYDNNIRRNKLKRDIFSKNEEVYDPYTGEIIEKSQKVSLDKYNTLDNSAEVDHTHPIKRVFEENKKNPWITNEDIKEVVNDYDNLQVVGRKYNNAKRAYTNEELINDEKYLQDKKLYLSEEGKEIAKRNGEAAEKAINSKLNKRMVKNIANTYNKAGIEGAKNAGGMTLTIAGLLNIIDFINGKKSLEEAIWDVSSSASKAAALGYITSGTTTVISHTIDSTFTSSSSSFLQKLGNSNASAKMITTVMIIGDTVKRYISGEMTTKECLIELGEKGATFAALSPAMAVGQACIPVPIVGAAVGALVGSIVTSGICQDIKRVLYNSELQKQHEKLIAEYEEILRYQKNFRKELDIILSNYLKDYENCFNDSLVQIGESFRLGNINQMIKGANEITKKLNGTVKFENIDEFTEFFMEEKIDIF